MIRNWKTTKIIMVIMFILVISVNALANILPINGRMTGEISDSYLNLFAPAGLTFSIWGLIYLLLAIYIIMTWLDGFSSETVPERDRKIGWWFIISSVANTIWIFMWHYDLILASLAMMIIILLSLAMIARELKKSPTEGLDRIKIALPFHVYFGWITVATIANVTTFLVSIGWDGFGLSESLWAVAIIIVGALIGTYIMWFYRSISYGLVILWAYIGIYIKHTSESGFNSVYSDVIFAVTGAIILLVVAIGFVAKSKAKKLSKG